MSLSNEIDQRKAEIRPSSLSMSIGEIINLYKDGDLRIRPEFQRLFRWTLQQQSQLIESILLGIPIPSIFVAADEEGRWDLVDGLQRISTILRFVGELNDPENKPLPASILQGTKFLPSLEGVTFEERDDGTGPSLGITQRRDFKRSKLQVEILERGSDEFSKFELFKRLNTGGSPAEQQEVRNCVLFSLNPRFFSWIESLSQVQSFRATTSLSDRSLREQYDKELVCRYLSLALKDTTNLQRIGDISTYVDNELEAMARDGSFTYDWWEDNFIKTFDLIHQVYSDNCFRKWDWDTGTFKGGFIISAYESVALGVSANIDVLSGDIASPQDRLKQLFSHADIEKWTGSGRRASERIRYTVPIGREIFTP